MNIGRKRAELASQIQDGVEEVRGAAAAGTVAFLAISVVAVAALLIATAALVKANRIG